jgi:uroporphyrinogen decarboxylase (EC 4.1.1.37)
MISNSVFLKACRREPTDYTPVWLMRQAGRYLREYRAIREKASFLAMCKNPDLAAEVTLQPIKLIGMDAAIIFADILLPLEPMGIKLEFSQGEGPIIHNPIQKEVDIEGLRIIEPDEDVPFVLEAIKKVVKELNSTIPLIGFAGGPFTLASYCIEGGHSQNFIKTNSLCTITQNIGIFLWKNSRRSLLAILMLRLRPARRLSRSLTAGWVA